MCGVFARHPCFPTVCGVFGRHPCYPDYWIGQDLRLTIESVSTGERRPAATTTIGPTPRTHKLDTLRAMFDALRACWIPPAKDEARAGMQMSVRFAFKRSGEIIATPRVTYVSPGAPPEARETYLHAISAALERCTPLPFSRRVGRGGGGSADRDPLCRQPGPAMMNSVRACGGGAGARRVGDRRGRATVPAAAQYAQRPRGRAAGMLGSAAARSVARRHAGHGPDELPAQR